MATLVIAPQAQKDGFRRPLPPTFPDDTTRAKYQKGQLALAARIMDAQGWGIGCAVGLSARDALDSQLVWVLPKGVPLCAVTSGSLVGVRLDGEAVGGGKYDTNYVPLHLAIYAARPDVNGITSGHTPHGRVFASRGEPLKMLWQDSCTFYNAVHELFFDEALNPTVEAVEAALKDGKGLILRNRGLLTCSATIEGATATYVRLENLCGGQIAVEAAIKGRGGELTFVGDEEARYTQQNTGSQHHAWMMAMPYYARITRAVGRGPLEI